jgi:cell division cycle protein 20 (cofactor of APC complex)
LIPWQCNADCNPVLRGLLKDALFCDNHSNVSQERHHNSIFANFHHNRVAKPNRERIPLHPVESLDAPDLARDFRLNVLAWSADGRLAAGLGTGIYVRSPPAAQHTDSNSEREVREIYDAKEAVCSVGWVTPNSAAQLAAGFERGSAAILDVQTSALRRVLPGHERCGALAALAGCNTYCLACGYEDGSIVLFDLRKGSDARVATLQAHKAHVCSLFWNHERSLLAAASADGQCTVWRLGSSLPELTLKDARGAIKGLAWCPRQGSLLATGGATTADTKMRIYNVQTGKLLHAVEAGQQVTGIHWSSESKELASVHAGANGGNHIVLWRYPGMVRVSLSPFKLFVTGWCNR